MQFTTEQSIAGQIYLERRSFVAVREAFRERFLTETLQQNVQYKEMSKSISGKAQI